MEAGVAWRQPSGSFFSNLFKLQALEKFELPRDLQVDEGDGEVDEVDSSSEEAAFPYDGRAFRREFRAVAAKGLQTKGAVDSKRESSFSEEERGEEAEPLTEEHQRESLARQIQKRNKERLSTLLAARSISVSEEPVPSTPSEVPKNSIPDLTLRLQHLARLQQAPQPWVGAQHSARIMEERTIDAAQRRKMRKAKQRVKEAEALRRQGDPEANRALKAANADFFAASTPSSLPRLLPVPSPPTMSVSPVSSSVFQNASLDSERSLDLGRGIKFAIPPFYDQLAHELGLPELANLELDERVLDSNLSDDDVLSLIKSKHGQHHEPNTNGVVSTIVPEKWGASKPRKPTERPKPESKSSSEVPSGQQDRGRGGQELDSGMSVSRSPFHDHTEQQEVPSAQHDKGHGGQEPESGMSGFRSSFHDHTKQQERADNWQGTGRDKSGSKPQEKDEHATVYARGGEGQEAARPKSGITELHQRTGNWPEAERPSPGPQFSYNEYIERHGRVGNWQEAPRFKSDNMELHARSVDWQETARQLPGSWPLTGDHREMHGRFGEWQEPLRSKPGEFHERVVGGWEKTEMPMPPSRPIFNDPRLLHEWQESGRLNSGPQPLLEELFELHRRASARPPLNQLFGLHERGVAFQEVRGAVSFQGNERHEVQANPPPPPLPPPLPPPPLPPPPLPLPPHGQSQQMTENRDWVLALPAVSHYSSDDDHSTGLRSGTAPLDLSTDKSAQYPSLEKTDISSQIFEPPGLYKGEQRQPTPPQGIPIGLPVLNISQSQISQLREISQHQGMAQMLEMPRIQELSRIQDLPLMREFTQMRELPQAREMPQIRELTIEEFLPLEQQQQQLSMKRLLRQEVKPDPDAIMREEFERVNRTWINLVRRDIPRWHRQFSLFHRKQVQDCKRTAELCQREARARTMRSVKAARQAPMRIRRLARDMVIFWKKVDKEQAEQRKKEERDALDARRREEEMREARRQQQRLNFLLSQTELYSHFMQEKLGAGIPNRGSSVMPEAGKELPLEKDLEKEEAEGEELGVKISDEEKAEIAALKEEALKAAEAAANEQYQRTSAFDNESSRLRQPVEGGGAGGEEGAFPEGSAVPGGATDMDLLNPSTMPAASSVSQPEMFKGRLKEYQLKGLQWLVNLYEQGLNGILADEMGLGKTIQAMSFLSHLAEEKNIWGPFLIVAPASVLSNWADEIARFLPDFRVLPYWGGLQERTVLRKNINPKRLYRRDAAFHALITSYQLMVSDEKYFRRVKWQYMVLDEAQAIKSAGSLRWKTLLSFNCRNRLLLTGTPIQNSMAELWALLHFIMPTLFDSHEQFNEWFSKGIEGHAEHGGTLNEHQLSRLHSVLKPFMLRRVKRDVEAEMTGKTEVTVPCSLSSRQKMLYNAIKHKISVADLFDSGKLNEKKVLHLMNIVIQLRKVCNHPELFERNEGRIFFHFDVTPYPLSPPPFGELEEVYYAGNRNPITYQMPKLVFRDGMRNLPTSFSGSAQGFTNMWLQNRFSLFAPDQIQQSLWLVDPEKHASLSSPAPTRSGSLGFLHLFDLSPGEVASIAHAPLFERWLLYLLSRREVSFLADIVEGNYNSVSRATEFETERNMDVSEEEEEDPRYTCVRKMLIIPSKGHRGIFRERHPTGNGCGSVNRVFEALVQCLPERMIDAICLLRAVWGFIPAVLAPLVEWKCFDRSFAYQQLELLQNPLVKRLLLGWARTSEEGGPRMPIRERGTFLIQELESREELQPLLMVPFRVFGAAPPMQSFDFAKMLTDSGKLHMLDQLLRQLRVGGHRVLVFAQMTKMLNILEDYMKYRKYKYLRLDGSSSIIDRRDMVKDFQQRTDIFVFLLSTRAGGLGINLTAADTVIFYESDWNPTMDLQAMDRAHRLGQTREVTVYRMICQGTVEEKIVKRANQKNTVQQLVMTGGQAQADVFDAEEVVSLLLDDAELERQVELARIKQMGQDRYKKKRGAGFLGGTKGIRLDAEGSAFMDTAVPEGTPPAASGVEAVGASDLNAPQGPLEGQGLENTGGSKRSRKRKNAGEEKPPKAPKEPRVRKPRVRAPRKKQTGDNESLQSGLPSNGSSLNEFPEPMPLTNPEFGLTSVSTGCNGGSDATPSSFSPVVLQNGSLIPSGQKRRGPGGGGKTEMGEGVVQPSKRGRPKGSTTSRDNGENGPSVVVHMNDTRSASIKLVGLSDLKEPMENIRGDFGKEELESRDGNGVGEKKSVTGSSVGRQRSRLPKKVKVHGPTYGAEESNEKVLDSIHSKRIGDGEG